MNGGTVVKAVARARCDIRESQNPLLQEPVINEFQNRSAIEISSKSELKPLSTSMKVGLLPKATSLEALRIFPTAKSEGTSSRSSVNPERFYFTAADQEYSIAPCCSGVKVTERMPGCLAYITGWCQSTSIKLLP